MPPIAGLETVPFLTNRTIFSLERLPARLVVLGGGPTGLELAQAFRRLGSAVAVAEFAERLLAAGEPETSAVVASVLAGEGIDVRVGTSTERVDSTGSEIAMHVAGGGTQRCDALPVATGRHAVLPPGAEAEAQRTGRGVVAATSPMEKVDRPRSSDGSAAVRSSAPSSSAFAPGSSSTRSRAPCRLVRSQGGSCR